MVRLGLREAEVKHIPSSPGGPRPDRAAAAAAIAQICAAPSPLSLYAAELRAADLERQRRRALQLNHEIRRRRFADALAEGTA